MVLETFRLVEFLLRRSVILSGLEVINNPAGINMRDLRPTV